MAFPGPRLPPELSSGEGPYPGGPSSGEDFSSPQGLFGAKCNSVVMMIISSDPRLWFPLKSKLVVILATQFLSLPLVSAKIVLAAIPCDDTQTLQDRA